ncbi:MAG: hypothetical protein EPN21_04425 [Methylococcaceae bacterium]|nr:MAG: hypothetical protein EPN21_04425 [Methylococcaceae bacterium]
MPQIIVAANTVIFGKDDCIRMALRVDGLVVMDSAGTLPDITAPLRAIMRQSAPAILAKFFSGMPGDSGATGQRSIAPMHQRRQHFAHCAASLFLRQRSTITHPAFFDALINCFAKDFSEPQPQNSEMRIKGRQFVFFH